MAKRGRKPGKAVLEKKKVKLTKVAEEFGLFVDDFPLDHKQLEVAWLVNKVEDYEQPQIAGFEVQPGMLCLYVRANQEYRTKARHYKNFVGCLESDIDNQYQYLYFSRKD